jgi:predicted transglutaminase-like cysteine proteinase
MSSHRTIHAAVLIFASLLAILAAPPNGLASNNATSLQDAKMVSDPPLPSQGESAERPAALIQPNVTSSRTETNDPFGSSTGRASEGPLTHAWQAVRTGVLADMARLERCPVEDDACSPAAEALRKIIADGRSHDGLARLGVINRAINLAIKATSDPYGWHSPLQALSAGEGDCKDYAVTKYLALLEAGFAEQDVKLVIVHDMATDQAHAIVIVHLNADWIVLDNRWLALVRDFELRRSVPLFILDENGVRRFDRQQATSHPVAQTGSAN